MEKIKYTRLLRQKYIYDVMCKEKEFLMECLAHKDSKKAMKIKGSLSRLFREGDMSLADIQSLRQGKESGANNWSSLLV